MTTDHRIIVRDNYNAVAQRVAAEWAALDAGHGCDPTRLAQDTAALIDALKQQRDAAVTALTDIMRLAGDHVFSSAPQENRALMDTMLAIGYAATGALVALQTTRRIAAANGEEGRG